MRLHVLGSGCPDPLPERFGSSFILEAGAESIMVDCGPATTYKMARMGIRPGRVGHLFFTHHHFDHNADFPCFALTRWDQSKGTEPPLQVYGPPPTRAFVDRLLGIDGAFFDDWNSRVKHPVAELCHTWRDGILPRRSPSIAVTEVAPDTVIQGDSWKVTAARVHHLEPYLQSLAYRFETSEGPIVFAGDCGDCAALRQLARGADTLVLACTHFGRAETPEVVVEVITGTPEVAAIATEAGVGRVVLTHVSPNFSQPGVQERAIADVARHYPGAIFFPKELSTIDLG